MSKKIKEIIVGEGIIPLRDEYEEIPFERIEDESLKEKLKRMEEFGIRKKKLKAFYKSKKPFLKMRFGQRTFSYLLVFDDDSIYSMQYGQIQSLYHKNMDEKYKKHILRKVPKGVAYV